MSEAKKSAMHLPQVDKILRHPLLEAEAERINRPVLAALTRRHLESLRRQLKDGGSPPGLEEVAEAVASMAAELLNSGVKRVINGTGVILNTNLGRSPLGAEAIESMSRIAAGYCDLEIDLKSGKRGQRTSFLTFLLQLITGCEHALVVNNNAAAVLLAVNTFGAGREVIVSRGELIEIGGSFRLPEVISSGGARLVEVGTTNRTRIADFKNAIGHETGLILRCHRSNFEITGFTEDTELEELVGLCRQANLPLVRDLGSGVLVDLNRYGLPDEPTVQDELASGVDLVTFSGDKLLGGPQAGIVVGKRVLVEKMQKNPLYRALRADKMILAALETTLKYYLQPDLANHLPILTMIKPGADEIRSRVESFISKAGSGLKNIKLEPLALKSTPGGGSLPGHGFASYGMEIKSNLSPDKMSALLRKMPSPVIAVIHDDKLLVDFRTVLGDDLSDLERSIGSLDHCMAGDRPSDNLQK